MSVKGIVKAAPCPFCGGKVLAMAHSEEDSEYYVGCYNINCFACGPGAPSEAEALAAWNRRAPARKEDRKGRRAGKADKLTIVIETSEEAGIVVRMDGVIGIKEMATSAAMLSARACELTNTSPVDFLTLFLDARKLREKELNDGGAV